MRDRGVDVVAMEVSSHALSMHRVDGTRFAVVVFTNLSRDHLDFHETMESYFEAKARLFEPELADRAVVNLDSPYGRLLLDAAKIPTTGYSLDDVDRPRGRPRPAAGSPGGASQVDLRPRRPVQRVATRWPRPRRRSRWASIRPTVAAGLSRPIVVPGRFELVEAGQPFRVVIDYAHTPDGLEQLLAAVRDVTGAGAGHGGVRVRRRP